VTRAVIASSDYQRIHALPQRKWNDADATELAELLTAELRTPFGKASLRPIQAVMIAEAVDAGGLFAACGVGAGKTIPSFLIPTMLGAKRPVLLVPASLRDKTLLDLRTWSCHFKTHPNLRVVTYEKISFDKDDTNILDQLQPDLIIADEAHALKNAVNSARGRKFMRYMAAHRDTKLVILSGTITRRSLKDYWHLIGMALPKTSPLPYLADEVDRWAAALDADVDEWTRFAPGVLINFAANEDHEAAQAANEDETDLARRGFQRRLSSTQGVVITHNVEGVDASLRIAERKVTLPDNVDLALRELRTTWCTPNGDELQQAVDIWRHARELACGFFYKWDPRPEDEWLEARKKWHKFVRHVLQQNRRGLDSPAQVARRYADDARYTRWRAVRDNYDPLLNRKAVWLSNFLVDDAAKWLKKTNGIAWVEHNAVGQRLSKVAGVPYFGGGPESSRAILTYEGPMIASIAAHGTGKNLQRYASNLLVSMRPEADRFEQLVGRTHRPGQEADEVDVAMYLHVPELREGLQKIIRDARYVQRTTGQDQKILYADRLIDAA
jgi:hypothetical protein